MVTMCLGLLLIAFAGSPILCAQDVQQDTTTKTVQVVQAITKKTVRSSQA